MMSRLVSCWWGAVGSMCQFNLLYLGIILDGCCLVQCILWHWWHRMLVQLSVVVAMEPSMEQLTWHCMLTHKSLTAQISKPI